ncbi:hypothetical protein LCGC14_0537040 [marine sediment metagenome]|uniref:HNH nuclease domain-containing protein n=1 Tax=marine sediment metagenome TaxID=412755 RepID=A0A0F9RYN7_9ZZZZ
MPSGIYKRKPHSNETKRKMSFAHKGKKFSAKHKENIGKAQKGKETWMKGKNHSVSARKKVSESLQGKIGKDARNWKDGRTKDMKTYRHRYRKDNKKKVNFYTQQRRVKIRGAIGSHTLGEWENLKAQYNWTCPCCLKGEPETKLTEDHIIPISRGGSNNIENIQPLCRGCNSKKYTKIIKFEVQGLQI